ncbi:MAG TPA: hypothetical protein VGO69_10670 [Pyrinomonadaceae bacterium]|nr:hypothetical protein [Pyrinomonadaceae bacterium]
MRARWHFWTSRRFCSQCAPRFRTAWGWLPALLGLALFGLGVGTGRAVRPAPPPLLVEHRQPPASPSQTALVQTPPANLKTGRPPASVGNETTVAGTQAQTLVDANETVSICGALTKKGTPCQRRVRGTGRCWQHKGQPAMLPLEQRVYRNPS